MLQTPLQRTQTPHHADDAYAELKARCDAAGQGHLLEDWAALSADERAALAAEIEVRCC